MKTASAPSICSDLENPPAPSPEILRHTFFVRAVHWLIAICFLLEVATGFALYWLRLRWLLPFFGGKHEAIAIHLISGMGLALLCVPILHQWWRRMRWTPADSHFVRHLRAHALRPEQAQPADTGYFNGGQKLFFWSFIISTAYFLITGLVWWWRREPWMPNEVYVVARTSHRVLAVIMTGALLVHLYKATLGEPGTLASMVKGTVTTNWARLRRPGWFRELGGRE